MKTMKMMEMIEIGSHLLELMANAKRVEIEKTEKGWVGTRIILHAGAVRGDVEDSPLNALRSLIDRTRKLEGLPTIEESANHAEEADAKHAASPIVEIGPSAHCSCGSKRPLLVQRNINFDVDWEMGIMRPVEDLDFITRHPGEIGTCPDCGKGYRFGA